VSAILFPDNPVPAPVNNALGVGVSQLGSTRWVIAANTWNNHQPHSDKAKISTWMRVVFDGSISSPEAMYSWQEQHRRGQVHVQPSYDQGRWCVSACAQVQRGNLPPDGIAQAEESKTSHRATQQSKTNSYLRKKAFINSLLCRVLHVDDLLHPHGLKHSHHSSGAIVKTGLQLLSNRFVIRHLDILAH
jgi:hypothetical protein